MRRNEIKTNIAQAQLLILGGAPLNELVVHYDRDVTSERQEIVKAVNGYQKGVLVK